MTTSDILDFLYGDKDYFIKLYNIVMRHLLWVYGYSPLRLTPPYKRLKSYNK